MTSQTKKHRDDAPLKLKAVWPKLDRYEAAICALGAVYVLFSVIQAIDGNKNTKEPTPDLLSSSRPLPVAKP